MYADLSRIPAARPFFFPRGRTGCLLIHGLASTPHTMRPMGEWLSSRGITVYAPLLAGHGRTWEHLAHHSWSDWFASVERGYELLRRRCRVVFAAGLSMGGMQALHLAAHRPELRGVISLSAALFVRDWRLAFLPVIRHLRRTLPPLPTSMMDPKATSEVGLSVLPVRAVVESFAMMAHLKGDLAQVRCPALVMHGTHDTIAAPDNAAFIRAGIGSKTKKLVMLRRSGHVITLDWEKERVFREALALIRRFSRPGGRRGRLI